MRRRYHNYTVTTQAGSICPACRRAQIIQGELGIYCPRCGWFPNWRPWCAVKLGGNNHDY